MVEEGIQLSVVKRNTGRVVDGITSLKASR